MKIQQLSPDVLRPYPGNPRRRDDATLDAIARALTEFGWRQPIVVDRDLVVVVGHGRLAAAQRLGLTRVPVHVASDLSPAKVRAYRLADNALAERAEWDDEALVAELLGVRDAGLDPLLSGLPAGDVERLLLGGGGTLPGVDLEEAPPRPAEPTTRPGDRYELGPHRLVCGSALEASAWERLMGRERWDLCFTDPPYGVHYVGKTSSALTIANDDLAVPELAAFLTDAFTQAGSRARPGAAWYVTAPHGPPFLAFALAATHLGWWRQTILWVKDAFTLSRQDYHWRHEAMLVGEQPAESDVGEAAEVTVLGYGWSPNAAHRFHGGRKQDTVWEVPRPRRNPDHPTMKPVALIERALLNSSVRGARVADCFAGSGSTLMACQAQGRVARCLELDPGYCDVIVERWQRATGQRARRHAA